MCGEQDLLRHALLRSVLSPMHEPDRIIIQQLIMGRLLLGGFQVGSRQEKVLRIREPPHMDHHALVRVNVVLKAQEFIGVHIRRSGFA